VCFLRPTRENVTLLKRELRNPRFQSYHLCELMHVGLPACSRCCCTWALL
jgi:hypothetical protein